MCLTPTTELREGDVALFRSCHRAHQVGGDKTMYLFLMLLSHNRIWIFVFWFLLESSTIDKCIIIRIRDNWIC